MFRLSVVRGSTVTSLPAWRVKLVIDQQTFYVGESMNHADAHWYRRQLQCALDRLVGKALQFALQPALKGE